MWASPNSLQGTCTHQEHSTRPRKCGVHCEYNNCGYLVINLFSPPQLNNGVSLPLDGTPIAPTKGSNLNSPTKYSNLLLEFTLVKSSGPTIEG